MLMNTASFRQCISHLGFTINSETMNVTLPSTKVLKIKDKCSKLYMSHNLSIRDVAAVIGTIVGTFPAVKFGPLHYRSLENYKIQAQDISKGNFDHVMSLSKTAFDDLRWWIDNVKAHLMTWQSRILKWLLLLMPNLLVGELSLAI